MMALVGAIGVFLVFFGIAVLIIGVIRHFFEFAEDFVPEEFKKPLSITYAAYYLLTGLVLLLLV